MHVFCCGLPLLLSITSIAAIFGVSSLHIFEIEWFEAVEDYVLIISGIVLAVTYVADRYSKKLDCLKEGFCSHPPCSEKKRASSYILKIAIGLYVVNVMTVLLNTLTA